MRRAVIWSVSCCCCSVRAVCLPVSSVSRACSASCAGSLLLQLGLECLQLSLLAAGAAGQVGKLLFDVFQIFRDRSGQKLHLLVLLRAAQHLVFRLAELAADGSKLKFGLRSGGSGLGRLRLERFKALRECVPFLGQLCKRVRARQNARALCGRAAGHTAARVHDLPVERDDSHAAAAGTRHAHGVIQRVADHGAGQGRFQSRRGTARRMRRGRRRRR